MVGMKKDYVVGINFSVWSHFVIDLVYVGCNHNSADAFSTSVEEGKKENLCFSLTSAQNSRYFWEIYPKVILYFELAVYLVGRPGWELLYLPPARQEGVVLRGFGVVLSHEDSVPQHLTYTSYISQSINQSKHQLFNQPLLQLFLIS